jgi:diguanylate cyclase (GGDEF)-like protein
MAANNLNGNHLTNTGVSYGQAEQWAQQAEEVIFSDPSKAFELASRALGVFSQPSYTGPAVFSLLGRAHLTVGRFHFHQGENDKAMAAFFEAMAMFQRGGNDVQTVYCLSHIAMNYIYSGLIPEGMEALFSALKRAEAICEESLVAEIMSHIGHTYVRHLNDPPKALPYLEKSLAFYEQREDPLQLSRVLDSLCLAYLGMGDTTHALQQELRCVELSLKNKAWIDYSDYMATAGKVYQRMGDLRQACRCYEQSLEVAETYGFRSEACQALCLLGDLYLEQEKEAKALELLQRAREAAAVLENPLLSIDVHRSLVAAHKRAGRFELALQCFEAYHQLKENLFSREADRRLKTLQVQHQVETARKEAEIYQLHTQSLQREILEKEKDQARLEELANTDPLTGLVNRRYFFKLAEQVFTEARRAHQPLAVIMIDIDHFKDVNDRHGHIAGDQVLCHVAERARANLRGGDVLARFGGEEFVLLLPNTDVTVARTIAERLRSRIQDQPLLLGYRSMPLTISAGIAGYEGYSSEQTFEKLLDQSDQALYEAKNAGRNRVVIYWPKE